MNSYYSFFPTTVLVALADRRSCMVSDILNFAHFSPVPRCLITVGKTFAHTFTTLFLPDTTKFR